MVNVTVYAMRFATWRELPRGCPFGVSNGHPIGGLDENLAMLIFIVSELGGLKWEVSYAYNGECNSVYDAICDMTGATQGVVLLGSVKGTSVGVLTKIWRC